MPIYRKILVFTTAVCALAACGIPRDPEGTLERVQGGVVRVGVVHNPPWASLAASGDPAGVEPRLVRALAAELGARVEWVPGGESELLGALEHHGLDLVIGGLSAASPWSPKLGFSRPYYTDTLAVAGEAPSQEQRVFAVPPGENGWLTRVERFLHARRDSIPTMLRREGR